MKQIIRQNLVRRCQPRWFWCASVLVGLVLHATGSAQPLSVGAETKPAVAIREERAAGRFIGTTELRSAMEQDRADAGPSDPLQEQWIQLFNGQDLTGWTPKIRHSPLGENYGQTFRVEDGVLKVIYDPEFYPQFDERFGHLFYEQPFSHYRLRAEYRFVGQQVAGGPGWAIRNNGFMLHCQDPKSMRVEQDFPVSIEVQLLGGDGQNPRTTANLCTPGTNVVLNSKLFLPHCTNSKSKTYHGEQWVTVEVEVRGSRSIKHFMEGEVVLEYTEPQLDPRDADAKSLSEARQGALLLEEGYISIQAESAPIEFRKIELLPLQP